jgi:antitoxin component YwqK of YwqJK toxin-antitoxin module
VQRSVSAFLLPALLSLALAAAGGSAFAVQVCELNGQPVNPSNGYTTEGKTGLMHCREGESGPVVREQELQRGKFMGVVRYFKDGALEKEYHVNERGNRDGLYREWARADPGGKNVLVREETDRDGHTVGLARSWYPTGTLRRVTFYGDDEREQAYAEFNAQGQLYELRCAPRPVLGSDFDDKAACGHAGAASTVVFYGGKGQPRARSTFEHGERKKSDTLWDDGSVREQQEATASGGVERSFAADGTKRHELQWASLSGNRSGRITTLDQEFHESGKLVRERRWRAGERGGEPTSESTWYLNGQPKTQIEFVTDSGRTLRRESEFHDNGKKSFEGTWIVGTRGGRDEIATGTHRSFDADGHLRAERSYDERGRLKHEREIDERGTVVRDDEVFEDGSRKAVGR